MLSNPQSAVELAVVVPVFNEAGCITAVLREWRDEVARHVSDFVIIVVDDGSTDATPQRLAELSWRELHVHRHNNRGHGQSCLVAYQLAEEFGAKYVLQIDSDGQCEPFYFKRLWSRRSEAVAIYGRRVRRDDGWARTMISFILRMLLKNLKRTRLNDTNAPYRLYHTSVAAEMARRVPTTFDLANIAIALLLESRGFIEEPIHFRRRSTGTASVRWRGFVKKAIRLVCDLKGI